MGETKDERMNKGRSGKYAITGKGIRREREGRTVIRREPNN